MDNKASLEESYVTGERKGKRKKEKKEKKEEKERVRIKENVRIDRPILKQI